MRYALYICLFLTFLGKIATAQEQITNFENKEVVFPTNVSFVDTLGKYIYFTAQTKLFEKPVLWISDGTITRPIKDTKGGFIYSINTKAVFNNKLYVYTTDLQVLYAISDSTTTEIALAEPTYPVVHLQSFDDSLAVITQQIEDSKYTIGVVNATKQYTLLQENIQYYIAEKDVLFWVKEDTKNAKDVLYRMDNAAVSVYYTFDKNYSFNSYSLKHNSLFGFDYFFGDFLLSIDPANKKKAVIREWGSGGYGHYNLPNVVYDKSNTPYFHKRNDGFLEIYSVLPNDSLNLAIKLNYGEIVKKPNTDSGEYLFHIEKENNEWYFMLCSEGCYKTYLTVYSSKKNEYKRSKDLRNSIIWGIHPLVVKIDSNSYSLTTYQRDIYNFQTQEWKKDTTFKYVTLRPDSLFFTTNNQFIVTDNVYLLTGNQKKALLKSETAFEQHSDALFKQMIFKDKLLFWTLIYNASKGSYQADVYASKGTKGSTQQILSLESITQDIQPVEFLGKLLFFSATPNLGFKLYETDGTKEGTKTLYEIKETPSIFSYGVSYNISKNIAFFSLYAGGKEFKYIKENKLYSIETKQFDAEPEVYLTDDVLYIKGYIEGKNTTLYTAENGVLKPLVANVGVSALYKNTLYFATQTGISYTNDGKTIKELVRIKENTFTIVGNWLVTSTDIFSLKYNKNYKEMVGAFSKQSMQWRNRNAFEFNDELLLINNNDTKSNILILRESNFITKVFDTNMDTVFPNSLGYWLFMQDGSTIFMDKTADDVKIIDTKEMYFMWGNYMLKNFMVIFKDNNNRGCYKWSYTEQKLEQVLDNVHTYAGYSFIDKANALVNLNYYHNNNYSYLHFNGEEIVEKYRIENFKYSNSFFGTAFRANKGYELAQIGADSLAFFPEIVKGEEGIVLGKAFMYKNSAYTYCFTPSHGWQVWEVGVLPTVSAADSTVKISPELLVSEILANEPTGTPKISVFPNPASSYVSIDSDDALGYRLIDERGNLLLENSTVNERNVNLINLPTGLYILQVYSETYSKSYKIIKKE